jgi:hypothetical protein
MNHGVFPLRHFLKAKNKEGKKSHPLFEKSQSLKAGQAAAIRPPAACTQVHLHL